MASNRGAAPKFAFVTACASAAGVAVCVYRRRLRAPPRPAWRQQLDEWCADGPAREPVVECEVPVSHGMSGRDVEVDVVEVPVGLLFECGRLRAVLREKLEVTDDAAAVVALRAFWEAADEEEEEAEAAVVELQLPWLDLAALAQLTYWYDRRPQSAVEPETPEGGGEETRLSDAKFGRWTKKVSREKVIYGTVALRYRSRGHLGQQVFRRPAGIDVTRISTLQRAAAVCGHDDLLALVEKTMEQLKPKNVARITWAEVQKHNTPDDLWLLIDRRVYDVTPFLGLHPGGGKLIVDVACKDATYAFEVTHGEGLRYSLRLLNQFFIGVCEDCDDAEPAEPGVPTPEFLETLRSITGALHTFDESRATGEAQGLLNQGRSG